MYDSIQLSKAASLGTTSQVTWPNDNKAVGNCFRALIGRLRPAGLILARRIAFPLVLLGAGLVLIQPCAGQSGTWTATGSHAHAGFIVQTATLLPNGKVLVAGSYPVVVYHPYPHVSYVSSAELYDPASGTWAVTGIPVTGISSRTATLLPNGEVLVAGASAQLYDPASGTWSATGSFGTARDDYTVTLLPNDKVLVSGGFNSVALASAELYDPARGTWSATSSLRTARHFHTATLLPNGKVLVAGGADVRGLPLASAELYDPASGTWTTTGSLNTARFLHTATLLPNGKVLVAGGEGGDTGGPLASAELYDPVSGTWTTTGSLNTARYIGHTATLLPNGKVLVAAGANALGALASAELYDPASGTWAATGSLVTARFDHTATLLLDGNVLVAGGYRGPGSPVPSAELYHTPASGPATNITNISTRLRVGTNDDVLIGGFIVGGTGPKQLVLRALGPTLTQFGVAGALPNPTLELRNSTGGLVAFNDNWGEAANAQSIPASLRPPNSLESAIFTSLNPGAYTAIVRGVSNTTGVALVEVYDVSPASTAHLTNFSTRGLVQTGNDVMIAGMIVQNNNQNVIVRALGPTLTSFGVTNALANPTLEVRNGNGTLIGFNDNWKSTQPAEITATGKAPPNDLESAMVRTLAPGSYTAIVRGVNNTTGVALVEVYTLP
jgi:hypothetical protein